MVRAICENKEFVSCLTAAAVWLAGWFLKPFPANTDVLQLILLEKPHIFHAIRWTYIAMWFTTPYILSSLVLSLGYIFVMKRERTVGRARLPRYLEPASRERLAVIVGEVHRPNKPGPADDPHWLTIPDRGLYTGIAVIGAVGSGKTSCCMYPFADQILAYRHADHDRRVGGLVLEVKGDFCYKVREILRNHGREEDYVEMSLESPYRYNPLHNDLEAYALAYGIASLLNNLFGKGKEPFWQQAYTNLVKFIILLHKVLYDYVTLFDVYECAINPDLLGQRIEEGRRQFEQVDYILVDAQAYLEHRELEKFEFHMDPEQNRMKAAVSGEVEQYLQEHDISYELQKEEGVEDSARLQDSNKREQFESVRRWFYNDWKRIEPKLRTSIVEGISVFLSLFDDNPAVKRTFCPPKECYDPEKNRDGRYGIPLPPFSEVIEAGAVCALNFPVSTNPGLAKAIGTFLNQDFQRALLNRIPHMEQRPEHDCREVLLLCDEYHAFASVGENDPTGDEKFFSLSRQAKCIPIVATQSISSLRSTLPGESWRTLLQTFRTKIFLALSDDFSTRIASDLCGKEEQLKEHYSISENSHDARVSFFSGRTTAHKSTVSASKSYNVLRDAVFEPKVFAELKNAQSIVLAYDGVNPLPPGYCYLKPYYLDPNRTYFEQLAAGEI
ncbi:MAG: TraM recognition domain-containing protein [bacterium]|nr:TraM recognition domain-containing protein [bacterium]